MNFPLLVLLVLVSSTLAERVCRGGDGKSHVGDTSDNHKRYLRLREQYRNCSVVDGNLEIVWFPERSYDFSFLRQVREVTGYVLIQQVHNHQITLPNLRVIRARSTYRQGRVDYGLLVLQTGLRKLEFPGLRDILDGSVGLFDNPHLCNLHSIDWDEIISSPNHGFYRDDDQPYLPQCARCDRDCEQGCWGDRPEDCQSFSKAICSGQCWQGRCFGPNPRDCCHHLCAAGCHGPAATDCLACKYLENDGACVLSCPPLWKFNHTQLTWEINPEGKYVHGSRCVRKCPQDTLIDEGTCVSACPAHKKPQNGRCISCSNKNCPKICRATWVVHSDNVDTFSGCTRIEGSIVIENLTFDGFRDLSSDFSVGVQHKPMHPDRLEVFSSLKEITGSLEIKAAHSDFKNLSYFRNLEVIGSDGDATLKIVGTSLEYLGLKSLKNLSGVNVEIRENRNLCYASMIDWTRLQKSTDKKCLLMYNKKSLNCIREGLVCDKQCSDEGCWGPGPTECLSCRNFFDRKNKVCIENDHR